MATSNHHVGDHLRTLRSVRGWSQEDVARELGVRGLAVGKWERGQANPSLENRMKLAEVFGVDPAEFGVDVYAPSGGAPEWFTEAQDAAEERARQRHEEMLQALRDLSVEVRAGRG